MPLLLLLVSGQVDKLETFRRPKSLSVLLGRKDDNKWSINYDNGLVAAASSSTSSIGE